MLREDALRSSGPTDWQEAFVSLPSSNPLSSSTANAIDADNDDDGLGFDPFSESAKGLQEMVEEERKVAAAAHHYHQANSFEPFLRMGESIDDDRRETGAQSRPFFDQFSSQRRE